MDKDRVSYLRQEAEAEKLSAAELAEIEDAFNAIPDDRLRDRRENATAMDMLDELEANIADGEKGAV